ncbi:MAG: Fe-S-cluster-containing dehydrogenase component, partial [Myxococcota bacterium]
SFNLMLNPDVLAREMGVMEKCTFCIQRIRETKDAWRDVNKLGKAPDEALQKLTACAQACPTDAITFGNALDAEGKVAQLFESERAYTMLGELNAKPGVRYLARINHVPSALHHGGGHGGDDASHGDAGDAGHGGDQNDGKDHDAENSGGHH